MNLLNLWFYLILMMLIASVGFRIWHRVLPPVRLERIGVREVARMVEDFLESSTDGTFGFPTGFFAIDRKVSIPDRIVARERITWSSHFVEILKRFFAAIISIASAAGCIGAFIGFFLALLLAPLVLYAAAAELALRFLLRSEIVAAASALPGDNAGSEVTFSLRGPSALLVGRAVQRAFHPPSLPERIRALAGLPTT